MFINIKRDLSYIKCAKGIIEFGFEWLNNNE